MRAGHAKFILSALVALGLPLAGCSSTQTDDATDSSEAANTEGKDGWGPSLSLRDDTETTPNRPPGGFYVTPIHASLMPSGKLLITGWGRSQQDTCVFPEGSRSHGTTFVLDPSTLTGITMPGQLPITPIDEQAEQTPSWTPDVLYCVGQVQTSNGILYTGGSRYQDLGVRGSEAEVGISSARVFDYSTGALRRLAGRMHGGPQAEPIKSRPQYGPQDKRGWRWYPTNTRLDDGRVLVTGGFSSLESPNYSVEIFDPASETFSTLVEHDDAYPPIREAMAPGLKDYTHTFLLPQPIAAANGGGRARQIAMMGWSGRVVLMSTDANVPNADRFTTRPHAARPGGNGGTGAAWDSSAALLPNGQLFVLGGTNDPAVARRADLYDPQADAWTQVDMGIGRRNAASVLLPDGNVLVMGGWDEDGNLPGDRRQPQVFDPRTKKVTTYPAWANDPFERGYHSFAILLKDASVLIGGGISPKVNGVEKSSIGCERNDIRIYRPSYLTKGPRPVIDAPEPMELELGAAATTNVPFHGATLAGSGGAVLMALGATTHAFDQNQRYVPLTYQVSGGSLTIKAPSDPVQAPEGDYLLFLVSSAGAPSEGKHVRLHRGAMPVPATSVVTFSVANATTTPGTNVYILGDAAELGAWDASRAIPLMPTAYPTWSGQVTLPRGKQVSLKFIKKDAAGNTTWEGGNNRTFSVPQAATSSFMGTWQN
jgi:hypothetical protein